MNRCAWSLGSEKLRKYHDEEWGKPSYDNRYMFEMLCLEGMQAGLSWSTILNKRDTYREVFYNFDVEKICLMTDEDVERLMLNEGIIRHRLKIQSIISNAKKVVELELDLSKFFWNYSDSIINSYEVESEVPALTSLSTLISNDLKKMGFKFVGPTIIYSFMQAIGMVNDHINSCEFK